MTAGRAWQTWAVLTAAVVAGQWAAGATFGYTIFAAVWGPVATVCILSPAAGRGAWRSTVGVVALTALPWWLAESWPTAGRLTLLLTAWTICLVTIVVFMRRLRVPALTAQTVAVIGWLTWLTVPLTRADAVRQAFGDAVLGHLLRAQPILAGNAVSDRAADWTHQAVAYRWLTVLGQDIPFDLVQTVWPSIIAHAAIALVLGSILAGVGLFRNRSGIRNDENVPRGTS